MGPSARPAGRPALGTRQDPGRDAGAGVGIATRATSRAGRLANVADEIADALDHVPEPPRAAFGWTESFDYRETFFSAHPELRGEVWVHHAVEQQVLRRYPDVVQPQQLHSLENLRGIPTAVNNELHLSALRREWNAFYRTHPEATLEDLLEYATQLDHKYGPQFLPEVQ